MAVPQATVANPRGSARQPALAAAGRLLTARPALTVAAGAFVIAFSAILVRLAEVAPATAATFRCAYAVPVLAVVAWFERRRHGPRRPREIAMTAGAGVFFAADLVLWHLAIEDVGAGLATVLANVQVVLVPLAAWALLSERPSGRILAAIPVVLFGVLLISGELEGSSAYGEDPTRGAIFGLLTGVSYCGYLLLLRQGTGDVRRPGGPLLEATAVAAVASAIIGFAIGDIDLVPDWPAHGWLVLLAITSQVIGWLLINLAMPRMPAALTSVLLTIQPIGSVILGALLLSEAPSALQLLGVAVIIGTLVALAAGSRGRQAPADGDDVALPGPVVEPERLGP